MKKCENCNEPHDGSYGSGRFCSRSCANSRIITKQHKERNRQKLKGRKLVKRITKICEWCGEKFEIKISQTKRKFCSKLCNSRNAGRCGGLSSAKSRVKRSKNEILFYDMCKEHFKKVLHNKPIFNGWDADVIIEDIRYAVMWNGKWHYEKITESHSLKQVQNRDKLKIKEIEKCGYTPYIIKDMGKYNPIFVKEEFNKFINYCGW